MHRCKHHVFNADVLEDAIAIFTIQRCGSVQDVAVTTSLSFAGCYCPEKA